MIVKNNTPPMNPIGITKFRAAIKAQADAKSNNSAIAPRQFYEKVDKNLFINKEFCLKITSL